MGRKLKRAVAATVVVIAGVVIPSTVVLAGTGPTYHLSAKGGTVRFSATVKNAKTCIWSSSPKVAGFDATVKCKSGKVARSAKVPANTSTKARSYAMTLTVRGKSTTVDRWKVDEAGQVKHAANGSGTMTVSPSTLPASSLVNTLTFRYTAATGGITGGEVTIEVPTGWTAPTGCTTSSRGSLNFSGQTIEVSNLTLATNAKLTVTYGSSVDSDVYCGEGDGVAVPSSLGKYTFTTSEASVPSAAPVAIESSPVVTAAGPFATTTSVTLAGQANGCLGGGDAQWDCDFNLTATAVTSAPGEDSVSGGDEFISLLGIGTDVGSGSPTEFQENIGVTTTAYAVATFSGPGYLDSSGMSNILCLVVPPVGGTPTITAGSCPG